MATVTHGVATTDTANVESYVSGSFTPAAGDLLVVFVQATATIAVGGLTDSLGGTYTFVRSEDRSAGLTTIYCFVGDQLASGSELTLTFTNTGDPATGCTILAARVAGMTRVGSAAIKQSAGESGGNPTQTPAPVFSVAVDTNNPTLGFFATALNPPAITEPTGWTELADVGHPTPAAGGEYVSRDSGFTGTTITWGSAATDAFADIIVELDTSQAEIASSPTFIGRRGIGIERS